MNESEYTSALEAQVVSLQDVIVQMTRRGVQQQINPTGRLDPATGKPSPDVDDYLRQLDEARTWARRLGRTDALRRLHYDTKTYQVFWKDYDNRGAVRWLEAPEWLRDVL